MQISIFYLKQVIRVSISRRTGGPLLCFFLFFESIRGRDYFLSPEKKKTVVCRPTSGVFNALS